MELILRGMSSSQLLFVSVVDQIIFSQQISERVRVARREAEVQMSSPAFSMLELARHFADVERHLLHFGEIGVEVLAGIQPVLLAAMLGQRGELCFLHGSRVHK